MLIFAFGHQRRVGKNYAAMAVQGFLREKYPNIRCMTSNGFAYKLKDVCHQLYGWAGLREAWYYESHPEEKEIVLPKLGMSPREIWIKFGTDAGRDKAYRDTWVDYLLESTARHGKVDVLLIADLRFPNEFDRVKELGGYCIKIIRPDLPPSNDVADTALNNETRWDFLIPAPSGELEFLTRNINDYVSRIIEPRNEKFI